MKTFKILILLLLTLSCAPERRDVASVSGDSRQEENGVRKNIEVDKSLHILKTDGEISIDLLSLEGFPFTAKSSSFQPLEHSHVNASVLKDNFVLKYKINDFYLNSVTSSSSYVDEIILNLEENNVSFEFKIKLLVTVSNNGSTGVGGTTGNEKVRSYVHGEMITLAYENSMEDVLVIPGLEIDEKIVMAEVKSFSAGVEVLVEDEKSILLIGNARTLDGSLDLEIKTLNSRDNSITIISANIPYRVIPFQKDDSREVLELSLGAFGEGKTSFLESSDNPNENANDYSPILGLSYVSSRVISDELEEEELSFEIVQTRHLLRFKPLGLDSISGREDFEKLIKVGFLLGNGIEEIVDVKINYSFFDLNETQDIDKSKLKDLSKTEPFERESDTSLKIAINSMVFDIKDTTLEFEDKEITIVDLECKMVNVGFHVSGYEKIKEKFSVKVENINGSTFELNADEARYHNRSFGPDGRHFYILCFGKFVDEDGKVYETIEMDEFNDSPDRKMKDYGKSASDRTLFYHFRKTI